MSDLVEFLRARLAEDEAVARAVVIPAHEGPNAYKPHPELSEWFYDGGEVEYVQTPEMLAHKYPDRFYVTCDGEGLSPAVEADVATHIARHDPARVLREVEAKRRILTAHDVSSHMRWVGFPRADRQEHYCHEDQQAAPCRTLLALAGVYADHPDYQQEWAL